MSEKTLHEQAADDPRAETRTLSECTDSDSQESIDFASKNTDTLEDYPEGGLRAWLVVVGVFATLTCTFGMQFTVGVLQSHWETNQLRDYSSSTIGWISSVYLYLNMVLAVQVGPMFDRYGPRWLMIIGSVLFVLSIFLLGSCEKYYQFMLCLGGLSGVSAAFVSNPCMVVLSHWFHRRRGMASGIAMVGGSLGGVIFPMILRATLEPLGWVWSLRILAFIFTVLLTIGNICVKSRLPVKSQKGLFNLRCFRDSRFVWFTAAMLCMFYPLSDISKMKVLIVLLVVQFTITASMGLVPTYALEQGFSSETGFYLLAVYNGGAAIGRGLSGIISDRYGRFNTMSAAMTFAMVFIFVLWYPFGHYLGALYCFVVVMGFGTGTILCLLPVCLSQMCKTEEVGLWLGSCYLVISHG
ncbi:hypothetical protein N7466_005622 [Penicillium verhagenii]|uniref:uncharacterized protein n=1 Tax=Penicillium verhagenii TaxID=1562060 RepID=UPI0025450A42|nr:uncharacterized protein N7466_005622 [Penicillium verhagenii]KAJ5930129.1 hypothetical protein N7466_005622 [Penicillium verhagenii]